MMSGSEAHMRALSEASSSTGGAVLGMLIFTSICYTLFFMGLTAACCFGGNWFSTGEGVMLRAPPEKDQVVAMLDETWKKQFVRKVYVILGLQIFTTVVISSVMMLAGGVTLVEWVLTKGYWSIWVTLIASLVNLGVLMCYRSRFPHNMALLGSFTVFESLLVGFICAQYAAAGSGAIVIEAFAITSVVFIGLTIFTMQSKINFDFLGPGLFVAVLVLMVWGMFATFFFDNFIVNQLYALAGVIIFSLYVVYDTHQIMNNLSYDEYIMGAINLYLDFINLFLFILRLLSGGERN